MPFGGQNLLRELGDERQEVHRMSLHTVTTSLTGSNILSSGDEQRKGIATHGHGLTKIWIFFFFLNGVSTALFKCRRSLCAVQLFLEINIGP